MGLRNGQISKSRDKQTKENTNQNTNINIDTLEARGVDESAELTNTGIYQAVCLNIVDLGKRENNFGKPKRQLLYLFEIDERYTKGEWKDHRHIVHKYYNYSLSKNSEIIQDLEALRGYPYKETYDDKTDETTLWKNYNKKEILNFSDLIGQPLCLHVETGRATTSNRMQTKVVKILRPKENHNFKNENPLGYMPEWVKTMLPQNHSDENKEINYPEDDPPF